MDRGRPIATNRQAYNVRLVKAMLPDESLNDTLLALVQIFTANGESWNDAAPLSTTAPYAFDTEREPAVTKMKEKAGPCAVRDPAKRLRPDGKALRPRKSAGGISAHPCRPALPDGAYEEYGLVTPFVIASDVSIRTVSQIKEHNLDLPGVDIVEEAIRSYPDPT